MNNKMVFYILGKLVFSIGVVMLLPLAAAIIFKESILPFLVPLALCLLSGFLLSFKAPKNRQLSPRDGFVSVGLSWIVVSLFGCLPYIISGAIPNFIDAFFETVSGFSTTGATVITDIEAQAKSILLWRSFTQWLGGMGVLVFLLAILPRSDNNSSRYMHLMKAEVTGPTVDKLVARIADTARVLYGIYIALTLVEFILLCFGEMTVFESLNHSLTTASTGGFGVKNDSIASYSAYSQYVIAVFMLLFGINLNMFFLLITGHILRIFKNEELRLYLLVVALATVVISINVFALVGSVEGSFRAALFQTASIITTTGFVSADYEQWSSLSQLVILLLMFCGGCAGSTAGGMKVSRLLLLFKNGNRQIRYIQHPRSVISVKIDGKTVDHDTIRGTTSYIIMLIAIFVVSAICVIAAEGCDIVTGLSSVATCINNVGPALGELGPTDNFANLSAVTKLILCFDMLAGRLELFPILMLFSPSTWKKFA